MAGVPQTFDEQSAAEFLRDVSPDGAPLGAGALPVGQDQNPWTRYPKLGVNALTRGAVDVLGLPGLASNLMTRGLTAGANWLTGANVPATEGFATPQQLLSLTNELGLTGRPEAVPTTPAERYGSAATEGAVAGLVGGPLSAVAGAGGGVAGEAAHQLAPESSWLPPAAGLAFGLGFGGVTGLVKNALRGRAINQELDASEKALELARQRAAAASDAGFEAKPKIAARTKELEAASRVNFNSTKQQLQQELDAHAAMTQQKLEGEAAKLGVSATPQEAGEWLQAAARNWRNEVMPARMAALRKPLEEAVPSSTPVELKNYESALQGINKRAGDLQASADVLTEGGPKALLKALAARKAEGELASGTSGPVTSSWQNARELRSMLGDAMSNPSLMKGIGEQNLERLYKGLSQDLGAAAKGQGAEDLWNAYNEGSTALYKFANGPLSNIITSTERAAETVAPEAAASWVLRNGGKGGTVLQQLRDEIPEGINEVGSAALRNPALWGKLAPEAKNALVPERAQMVDELLAGGAQAKDEFNAAVKAAQEAHQANIAQAREAAASGRLEVSRQTRSASQAAREAVDRVQAAKAAKLEHFGKSRTLSQDLFHAGLGTLAGQLIGHTPESTLTGTLLGYGIPIAARGLAGGAKAALEPNQLMFPGIAGYEANAAAGQSGRGR